MARARRPAASGTGDDGTGASTLQSRLVNKLSKDKDVGGVIKLASGSLLSDTPYYVSTQSAMLDYTIGQPGIPASKVTTIFGREGSGKSTAAYHLLAETQRIGGVGVLVDSEQRFTHDRAVNMGVKPDELIVVEGATMEKSFESIEKIVDGVRAESIDIPVTVVYDSLAGSVTEKRLDADVNDVIVATAARFVGGELPRLKLKIAKLGVALVIVNQVRSRMQFGGDPRTSAYRERMKVMGREHAMLAEWPLIFESALMLYVNAVNTIDNGDDKDHPTGIRSRFTVRKCGISPHEGWRGEVDIDYLTGFDKLGSKFELLEELGYIKHTSAGWYTWRLNTIEDFDPNAKKFQRRGFDEFLLENPSLEDCIKESPTLWTRG